MDEPRLDPNSSKAKALKICDITFTSIFTIESALKIIVYGFVKKRWTYLRDGWNVLDFVIVLFGWISMALSNISAFKGIITIITKTTITKTKIIITTRLKVSKIIIIITVTITQYSPNKTNKQYQ